VILGAPHALYRELEIPSDKLVVDVWGFWPAHKPSRQQSQAASLV
jgi:hypothetical protein